MQFPCRHLILIVSLLLALALVCSSVPSRDLSFPPKIQASSNQVVSTQTDKSVALAVLVKAPKANLRDKPSVSGSVVKTVEKGDLLTLISSTSVGPWYPVRENKAGPEAWIHGNAIVLLYADANATESDTWQRPRVASPTTSGRSYVNVDGVRVQSPVFTDKKPAGRAHGAGMAPTVSVNTDKGRVRIMAE